LSDTFIDDNLKLKNSAILDKNGEFCYAATKNTPVYQTKTCLQNAPEKGYCTLNYQLTYDDNSSWEKITDIVTVIPSHGDYSHAIFNYTPKTDGFVIGYAIDYSMTGYSYAHTAYGCPHRVKEKGTFNFAGITTEYDQQTEKKIVLNKQLILNVPYAIQKDNAIPLTFTRQVYYHRNVPKLDNLSNEFKNMRKLIIRIEISRKKPHITWIRQCDFPLDKNKTIPAYYKVIDNRCEVDTVDEATAQLIGEKLACYGYQEVYQKSDTFHQSKECMALHINKNCTQEKIICTIYDEENHCTQQQISYSCETPKKINGYQCGHTFYKDCEREDCDQSQKSQQFPEAISQLQTITEAARDINQDPNNIKIFTGRALQCRKTAVGYNNCCADSGWGQSLGIAGCDNEEKELGTAKEKGLTIAIGEYCSKKVLGVCMQKKRTYCAFSSKLAKIIQEQGREKQLGVGFGSAKDPDCRGLLFDEFGKINFDTIDFYEFYGNLNQQIALPNEQTIKRKLGSIHTND